MKLEDEAEIPEKPKNPLIQPNQKHHDKELAAIDEEIKKHKKSIEELKDKIQKEKFGDNPEITRITKEKDDLKAKREPINAQITEIETTLKKPREELAALKSEKEHLGKEIDVFKIESLSAEIRAIQQKLGFSSLSISDEKKLIDRKSRLDSQKPKVQKYSEISAKIKALHDSNEAGFSKLKSLYEVRKDLSDKIKKHSEKIKAYLDNKKQNDPKVNQLKEQQKNIHEEIDKLYKKKDDLRYEFDQKWKAYNNEQRLIKYIKEATDKINELKKRKAREEKRKEREAKENANTAATLTEGTKAVKEEPFAYEIWTCDWLVNYFKNITGENAQQTNTPQTQTSNVNTNSKIDEDISKGLIKPFTRQDDDFIGLSTSTTVQPKKKTKGPKVSKREQKAVSSNMIVLDISIIKKIQDVQLAPPILKTDIPSFISQLAKTKETFQTKAEVEKKNQAEAEAHVNANGLNEKPSEEIKQEKAPEEVKEAPAEKNPEVKNEEPLEEVKFLIYFNNFLKYIFKLIL